MVQINLLYQEATQQETDVYTVSIINIISTYIGISQLIMFNSHIEHVCVYCFNIQWMMHQQYNHISLTNIIGPWEATLFSLP